MPIRNELSGLVVWLLLLCMVGVKAYRTRRRYYREYRGRVLRPEAQSDARATRRGALRLIALTAAVLAVAACCYVGAVELVNQACTALNG